MNCFDNSYEDVQVTIGGRKKKADPSTHNRQVEKRARYSGFGKTPQKACKHDSTDSICRAEFLNLTDIQLNFEKFYASSDKVEQDAFLLRLMVISFAKRVRVEEEARKKNRKVTSTFHLMTSGEQGQVRVCKATFCSVLGVSLDRVSRLARYFSKNKSARPENRGGHKEPDQEKRDLVIGHIKQFKCRPSHYSRKDSPGRRYLPSDLNISIMYRMFQRQNGTQVCYSTYHSIFQGHFNLGFGHPATDICSTCLQYKNGMRDAALSDDEKKVVAAKFIFHRRQARKFYTEMNLVENTTTVCFDMMENLVLPRTAIGQAYYSRQLYMYIFGIVVHRADGTQKKNDIHLYTWLECENRKDSNMVASALHSFLADNLKNELGTQSSLRLFSDSCYGQNKNMNVLSMLLALRKQKYPQLDIKFTFPVRGHSYLPADRIFGRIQQEIRKRPSISLPEEYVEIMRNHGTVHRYLDDWRSYNYKKEAAAYIKGQRPFKISEAKMINICGSGIGIKSSYSGDYAMFPVLKKGKKWDNFSPEVLPPSSQVNPQKRADVLKLLHEISAPANIMAFYEDKLQATKPKTYRDSSEEGSETE